MTTAPVVTTSVIRVPVSRTEPTGLLRLATTTVTTTTTTTLTLDNATGVVLGGGSGGSSGGISNQAHYGGNFVLGGWLDCDRTIGLEGGYLFLASRSSNSQVSSTGDIPLAIPFTQETTTIQRGFPVGTRPTTNLQNTTANFSTGVVLPLTTRTVTSASSGTVALSGSSQLQGAELNAVLGAYDGCNFRAVLLAGFRYAGLDERIGITSMVTQNSTDTTTFNPALLLPTGGIPVANSLTMVSTRADQFDTHNSFYGGQIGARGEYCWHWLSLEVGGKLALGSMVEVANVGGSTAFTTTSTVTPTMLVTPGGIPLNPATGAPAVTTTTSGQLPGGFFAQPSNMGHYSRTAFAVVPEVNIKVGAQLTDWLRATVGYTFLYMSEVLRPGDQIDRTINPGWLTVPPTPGARPAFPFRTSDFYAQGLEFGLELRY
jgi:hypothetical protein